MQQLQKGLEGSGQGSACAVTPYKEKSQTTTKCLSKSARLSLGGRIYAFGFSHSQPWHTVGVQLGLRAACRRVGVMGDGLGQAWRVTALLTARAPALSLTVQKSLGIDQSPKQRALVNMGLKDFLHNTG